MLILMRKAGQSIDIGTIRFTVLEIVNGRVFRNEKHRYSGEPGAVLGWDEKRGEIYSVFGDEE